MGSLEWGTRVWALVVGGICAALAIIISLIEMVNHCRFNNDPVLQRYVLRILFMVPLYALNAYFGLLMKDHTEYWDLAREAYEAVVVYSFYEFLVAYIGGSQRLVYLATLQRDSTEDNPALTSPRSNGSPDEEFGPDDRLAGHVEAYAPPRASIETAQGMTEVNPPKRTKGGYYQLEENGGSDGDDQAAETNTVRESGELGRKPERSLRTYGYDPSRTPPMGAQNYNPNHFSRTTSTIDSRTMMYLDEADRHASLQHPREFRHMIPCRWMCRATLTPKEFVQMTKFGALQYVPCQLMICTLTFILSVTGDFEYGKWSISAVYPYFAFITNISQIWAMYCLFWFYNAYHVQLAPCQPLWKAACIKGVVFFTFWQSVIISLCSYFYPTDCEEFPAPESDRRKCTESDYTTEQRGRAIQNFIICIEMLLFAIAHMRVFSYREFINRPHMDERPLFRRVVNFFSPADMVQDVGYMVKENVRSLASVGVRARDSLGIKSNSKASSPETEHELTGIKQSSSTSYSDAVELEESTSVSFSPAQNAIESKGEMDMPLAAPDVVVDGAQFDPPETEPLTPTNHTTVEITPAHTEPGKGIE